MIEKRYGVIGMEDWKHRLIKERDELEDKYTKLSEFMDTEEYKSLKTYERQLICEQSGAMFQYLCTLVRRIALYGVE